jgi:hypothetical protein
MNIWYVSEEKKNHKLVGHQFIPERNFSTIEIIYNLHVCTDDTRKISPHLLALISHFHKKKPLLAVKHNDGQ